MSAAALQELYDGRALKPAASLWELAEAHVRFAELGATPAPEPAVSAALAEGDGVAVLIGPSGSGKSSVLAYVARDLAATINAAGRHFLPVFLPVAGRPEHASRLDVFGKGVMREVLFALHGQLGEHHREKLERSMADQVTHQSSGAKFVSKITALIPGLSGEVGFELASDVVSVVHRPDLDNHGGLKTLGDIVRARGYELVVVVEDTDALAFDETGAQARAFFRAVVRPLTSEVDVGVAIAVQSPWLDGERRLQEAMAVVERAVTAPRMPSPGSDASARGMVEAVLARRVERGLENPGSLGENPVAALFTDAALDALGHELRASGSMRKPLTRVRDAIDRRADTGMPDRLDVTDLLEIS